MMDVLLVVFEQLKFLQCELVRFQSYFETVGRFWGSLQSVILACMDGSDQIECIHLTLLFPVTGSASPPRKIYLKAD